MLDWVWQVGISGCSCARGTESETIYLSCDYVTALALVGYGALHDKLTIDILRCFALVTPITR